VFFEYNGHHDHCDQLRNLFDVSKSWAGDYRGKVGGDLLRWAAHCVFGTILRFHGGEHQPWSYDTATEDVIRQYLNARYKLMPSFIAAGVQASQTGFPLVVRCDLFWPEHSEASSNEQYVHLNETLIGKVVGVVVGGGGWWCLVVDGGGWWWMVVDGGGWLFMM
jgi:hypothetical protein